MKTPTDTKRLGKTWRAQKSKHRPGGKELLLGPPVVPRQFLVEAHADGTPGRRGQGALVRDAETHAH